MVGFGRPPVRFVVELRDGAVRFAGACDRAFELETRHRFSATTPDRALRPTASPAFLASY